VLRKRSEQTAGRPDDELAAHFAEPVGAYFTFSLFIHDSPNIRMSALGR